jgi:hypothetical protein
MSFRLPRTGSEKLQGPATKSHSIIGSISVRIFLRYEMRRKLNWETFFRFGFSAVGADLTAGKRVG